ncbi:MAG: two-component system alkaline phosphatase synthesis response regulator PhoP [Polaribacter sp.]|jgi:two-component system alkaline phosphatase synthesis response regulator PhoP
MNNEDVKILIVDDEKDILEFVSYNLKKEGFSIITASNGLEGIEIATREKPNLILLDIMMPEMDGIEVCRSLRKSEEFNQTMITFLTARGEDFTQISALEAGGDDFIAKPIRPRVLVSRIKALLRRTERTEESKDFEMVLGDLVINKENFSVHLREKSIELAKKEFELLSLLASRPGKVFTRDEIFHKVWGTDVIVGNRTIDVHIRKLREKLGDNYIRTVKGIGYKFEF